MEKDIKDFILSKIITGKYGDKDLEIIEVLDNSITFLVKPINEESIRYIEEMKTKYNLTEPMTANYPIVGIKSMIREYKLEKLLG